MKTKEEYINILSGPVPLNEEYKRSMIEQCLDGWAKVVVDAFGRFLLYNEVRYERNENPQWGYLSHSQKEEKFFKELNDYL